MEREQFDFFAYGRLSDESRKTVIENQGGSFLKLGTDLIDFLHHGEFASEQSRLDHFLYDALARCANEIICIHATLGSGSYLGAIQHIRALIELHMSVTYMFYNGNALVSENMLKRRSDTLDAATKRETVDVRVEKYLQHKELQRYLYFMDLDQNLAAGLSDQHLLKKFDTMRPLVDQNVKAADEKMLANWCELFGVKINQLSKVRAWHSPYSIRDLLDLAKDVEAGTNETYDLLCNFTHISPFQFFFEGGHSTLGVTSEGVRQAFHDAEVLVRSVFKRIDDGDRLNLKLTPKFTPYTPGTRR